MLNTIINHKRFEVKQRSSQFPLSSFKENIKDSDREFKAALSKKGHRFILECKKASPSKGLIRKNFDLKHIAECYKPFADAISVLTDSHFFQGQHKYLREIKTYLHQPILCKDFILSDYQIYEARIYGADAILLMLSVLNDTDYSRLASLAKQYKMDVLTEVHSESELNRALHLGADIIGINNRNLNDLTIDLKTTDLLAAKIPDDIVVVSESGYSNNQQIRNADSRVDAFLIGSSLMGSERLDLAVRELLFDRIKICGLIEQSDVDAAYQNGTTFCGFIFATASQRKLPLQFDYLETPAKKVAIYQNQSHEYITETSAILGANVIQLHGDETDQFIKQLRTKLDPDIEIWKSAHTKESTFSNYANRLLFDTCINGKSGGSGSPFNWNKIPDEHRTRMVLAGGLGPENIQKAMKQNAWAYDVNSRVEVKPGRKDSKKMKQLFKQIKYGPL